MIEGTALGVSGTSVVHAAGHGNTTLWQAVATGDTGLHLNNMSWCDLKCWIGAVPGLEDVTIPQRLRFWDSRIHRLIWLALEDPDFTRAVRVAIGRHGAHRIGLLLGTTTSGIRTTEIAYAQRRVGGDWPAEFDYRRTHSVDAVCRFSAEVLGLEGPTVAITTACSSSAKVFLTAKRWIELGVVDAAVVGGVDSLCLSTLHGFDAMQLLASDICRPFDAARSGISIGEAAGFMLLERQPSDVQFLGGGESGDAWHMSAPHPEGIGAYDAMHAALSMAGIGPSDIGYVNAHGTGTPANDRAEAVALCAVFGERATPVSSIKGVTGHTLGAAGIVDAIVTVLALQHQVLPTSANVLTPDPTLAVDVVTQARATRFRYAMTNNFGFGGSNVSLVFGRTG